MKINLAFSLAELVYTRPIKVRLKNLTNNKLLCVSIFSNDEHMGDLEFAGLPDFNQYSLQEWRFVLNSFFANHEISLDNIDLHLPFFNSVSNIQNNYTGELLFIIESVLFCILKKKMPALFSETQTVKLNAMYSSPDQLDGQVQCLKIKIRPNEASLSETANVMNKMCSLNPDIKFRLDGNQSFELSELCQFMEELMRAMKKDFLQCIEYLEEPFKNYNDYFTFRKLYPYPLGLDESLLSINNINKIEIVKESYFIIKPSLLGISKSLNLIKLAQKNNCTPVISSSYETKNTMRSLIYLAAINPETFHGLDTLKFLPSPYGIEVRNYTISAN